MKSFNHRFKKLCKFWIVLAVFGCARLSAQNLEKLLSQADQSVQRISKTVFRDSVSPNWLQDGSRFWYRVRTGPDSYENVLVDALSGSIKRTETLDELGIPKPKPVLTSTASALEWKQSTRTGESSTLHVTNSLNEPIRLFWIDNDGNRRPYGEVKVNQSVTQSTFEGHVWLLTDSTDFVIGYYESTADKLEIQVDAKPPVKNRESDSIAPPPMSSREGVSPNLMWTIEFNNHNVELIQRNGQRRQLSTSGTSTNPFRGPIVWSPDSRVVAVFQVELPERRKVSIVNSAPDDQLQPKLVQLDYLKPGDAIPKPRIALIKAPVFEELPDSNPLMLIDNSLFPNPFNEWGTLPIEWAPDSQSLFINYSERGHQRYSILSVDAESGSVRTIVDEHSQTFIESNAKTWHHWLHASGELLWMSERDNWAHLWLIDVKTGDIKNQVTNGSWVVREILHVDETNRQVWFLAGGLNLSDDPYYRHLCRVNFDGSGFLPLTVGNGDHQVDFSPDRQFFLDRWSRVDQPIVTELRRCRDGSLVCELERSDASRMLALGFELPERLVAKGRDGTTDIYGILIKPSHFDPTKKYPIVEEVYAGPHGAFTPKRFGLLSRQRQVAELGCIVLQSDGMGTNFRGKTFHDTCWKNLEDAGFADRIAWIKNAAKDRPWMDLSRVGIYGGSAGGQTAMRALIDHHDFYHVAVADCGCHDNRMDKIWWNEQWLGWPVDECYSRASNVEHAHRMEGHLLLMVGELDSNVDPASTMQVVRALQKANKFFEFMPIVGQGHGSAETPFGSRMRASFLAKHLILNP
jgi:dipeptidyl-peptidase 4